MGPKNYVSYQLSTTFELDIFSSTLHISIESLICIDESTSRELAPSNTSKSSWVKDAPTIEGYEFERIDPTAHLPWGDIGGEVVQPPTLYHL